MFVQNHHSLEELQRLTKVLRLETGPGGPRGLLPQGSRGSVRALSGIRLVIS